MPVADVLDSHIHFGERGRGDPIVLLHGNPTSSYLWRNVVPRLEGTGRCLVPDLIGMGQSGKPDSAYRLEDHGRYLWAWLDALDLHRVTFVLHDWGGPLGFGWAARNHDRVAGVAFMETIVKPLTWDEWPERARDIFRAFRTPGTGEELIFDRNLFVEAVLPASILRTLADDEMATYRAPFHDRQSRRPTLAWPRELPIEGDPADVVAEVEEFGRWLASSDDVPKLLLTFEPGAIMSPPVVAWCRETIASLDVEACGRAMHFVQEDEPERIGDAIVRWRQRTGIAR